MWCIQLHLISSFSFSSHPASDRQTIEVEALHFVLHLILAWINICSRGVSTAGHDFPVPCMSISFSCIRFSWANFREQTVYTAFWSAACSEGRRRRDSSISSTSHRMFTFSFCYSWYMKPIIGDITSSLWINTEWEHAIVGRLLFPLHTLQTHYLVAWVARPSCGGVWVMWSAATPHT